MEENEEKKNKRSYKMLLSSIILEHEKSVLLNVLIMVYMVEHKPYQESAQ